MSERHVHIGGSDGDLTVDAATGEIVRRDPEGCYGDIARLDVAECRRRSTSSLIELSFSM